MLTVNGERLLKNLRALAQIGATAEGGVSRPAMSAADVEGRAWFRELVETAGFEFRADGAGNLSAILRSEHPSARTILMGSHLDTVPNGGRFEWGIGRASSF